MRKNYSIWEDKENSFNFEYANVTWVLIICFRNLFLQCPLDNYPGIWFSNRIAKISV